MELIGFVLSSVLLFVLIHLITRSRKNAEFVKAVDKIPGPSFLAFTKILQYIPCPLEVPFLMLPGWFDKYGPVIRVWLPNQVKVIIKRAKDVAVVIHGKTNLSKPKDYRYVSEFIGYAIITLSGKKWHEQRKMLNPVFHSSNLNTALPTIRKHVHKLVLKLRKEKSKISIHEILHDCVVDIVFEHYFGYESDDIKDNKRDLQHSTECSSVIMTKRFFTFLRWDWIYARSPHKKEMDHHQEIINKIADNIIAHWTEKFKNGGENFETGDHNLMVALKDIILSKDVSQPEVHKQLRDQIKTFMAAAIETTAVATCSVLFLLGSYPEQQEKVFNEIREVLGDAEPDNRTINELKLLDRCVKETLRLYPTLPFVERRLTEDAKLDDGLVIPAKCITVVSIYHLHRDPEVYPNPEHFDPDRFLPENVVNRHPFAYLPFSAGPRNCIGRMFAMTTMKHILVAILRECRVEAAEAREDLKMEVKVVLFPKYRYLLRLSEREENIQKSTQEQGA